MNAAASVNTPAAAAAAALKARPITLEEKRARQRAYVKKSYYRQQSTVHALKQQVQQLEVEYKRLESAVTRSGPEDSQAILHTEEKDELLGENDTDGDDCDTMTLTNAYTRLTLLKEKLREENRVLANAVLEHEKFQHQLGNLVDAEKNSSGPSSSASRSATNNPNGFSKARRPPVMIKPFTVEECQQIAAKCYARLFQFQQSNFFESTGANVFGWRDERRVLDGDRFDFSIKKFFYGHTASNLSLAGWRVTSSPRFRDLFPSTLDIDVYILQQVDADNVVVYREIHSADGLLVEKTMFLTSRIRIDNGYINLFQSVDPTGRLADAAEREPQSESASALDVKLRKEPKVVWRGLLSWAVFEEAGENAEHCMFKFGGMVPSNSAVWMLEILLIVLRWENLVIGPVFSIC